MIVEKLNIFNFRSFDHSGMIYDLKKGMDTIVGENGFGKSNIVSAFKAFSEMPGTNQIFNKEDYFEGNTNNPIKLQMNISLVDKDILFLIRELDIDMIVQDFEEVFGKDLFIEIVYYNNRSKYLNFKIGNIFLYEGGASKLNLVNTTVIDYSSSPTLRSFQSNTASLKSQIQEFFDEQPVNRMLIIEKNIVQLLGNLIADEMMIFPEFRDRPVVTNTEARNATHGRDLSSVLFNLKNGDDPENKKV